MPNIEPALLHVRQLPETYTGNPYPGFWALQEFFWKEIKWYERENL